MSTLNTLIVQPFASLPASGEVIRIGEWPAGVIRSIANLRAIHRRQVVVAGGVAVTARTLWNSAVDSPAEFLFAAVVADPDNKRSDDRLVDVRIVNNGVASVWRLSRNVPLFLGPSPQTAGAITLVEVLNLGATETPDDDVEVALTVLDDAA